MPRTLRLFQKSPRACGCLWACGGATYFRKCSTEVVALAGHLGLGKVGAQPLWSVVTVTQKHSWACRGGGARALGVAGAEGKRNRYDTAPGPRGPARACSPRPPLQCPLSVGGSHLWACQPVQGTRSMAARSTWEPLPWSSCGRWCHLDSPPGGGEGVQSSLSVLGAARGPHCHGGAMEAAAPWRAMWMRPAQAGHGGGKVPFCVPLGDSTARPVLVGSAKWPCPWPVQYTAPHRPSSRPGPPCLLLLLR